MFKGTKNWQVLTSLKYLKFCITNAQNFNKCKFQKHTIKIQF